MTEPPIPGEVGVVRVSEGHGTNTVRMGVSWPSTSCPETEVLDYRTSLNPEGLSRKTSPSPQSNFCSPTKSGDSGFSDSDSSCLSSPCRVRKPRHISRVYLQGSSRKEEQDLQGSSRQEEQDQNTFSKPEEHYHGPSSRQEKYESSSSMQEEQYKSSSYRQEEHHKNPASGQKEHQQSPSSLPVYISHSSTQTLEMSKRRPGRLRRLVREGGWEGGLEGARRIRGNSSRSSDAASVDSDSDEDPLVMSLNLQPPALPVWTVSMSASTASSTPSTSTTVSELSESSSLSSPSVSSQHSSKPLPK